MTDPPLTHPESFGRITRRLAAWFCCGVVLAAAIGFMAAHLLEGKPVGLFEVAAGAIMGLGLGYLVRFTRSHYLRTVLAGAFLLVAIGQCVLVAESYRQWRADRLAEFDRQMEKQPMAALMAGTQRQALESERLTVERYLAYRGQPFREAKLTVLEPLAGWPKTVLTVAAVLGSFAGAWIAMRFARSPFCTVCQSWHEPKPTVLLGASAGTSYLRIFDSASDELPKESRLSIECIGCRCPDRTPAVTCRIEQRGCRDRVVLETHPNRETYEAALRLLDEVERF